MDWMKSRPLLVAGLCAVLMAAISLGCRPAGGKAMPEVAEPSPASTDGDDSGSPANGTADSLPDALSREAIQFAEPAGISYAGGMLYVADTNNHKIRTIDLRDNYRTATLDIEGLKPPKVPPEPEVVLMPPLPENGEVGDRPEDEADDEVDPRTAPPRPPVPPVDEDDLGEDILEMEGHPFPSGIAMPFDLPDGHEWVNTSKPLKLADFKGKFVLIDFWTYCCINCIHVLPELKKLERAFPYELVVIGVHSAKFETEKEIKNIQEAVLRYEIEHPVVNDPEHEIWSMFGARSWPTLVLIDPEGKFVGRVSGEIQAEPFAELLQNALPYYREKDLLDRTPVKFDLLKHQDTPSPLKFPGKVLADEASSRLFIADSNNNRLVISTLDGKLIDTIGTGAIGQDDGGYAEATFNKPQGMALFEETLYVADTENHLLRKIDLENRTVTTIAGTGVQGRGPWPGMDRFHPFAAPPERFVAPPLEYAINSPWDLYIHGDDLYIAMAGPHQIWKMPLDESEIGPYAGNGREDIVDGRLLPPTPYAMGYSSFAQPSGLASDGTWLYVADSEGSSVRAVPFDPETEVKTVVGTSKLPSSRLFVFGHRDGQGVLALNVPLENFRGRADQTDGPTLQHCLCLAYHDGKLYVADTYNDAIKEIDLANGTCKTIAGAQPEAN